MYKLESIYGKRAFDRWHRDMPTDLRPWRCSSSEASAAGPWEVRSYPQLVDAVSFLAVMNKRLSMVFRGQSGDRGTILPTLFRPTWTPPDWSGLPTVPISDRRHYCDQLSALSGLVFRICEKRGIPRFRSLRDVREAAWAVVQHYELWPTPLIDVTSSLRTAASFALEDREDADAGTFTGTLYVVAMPGRTGSIGFHLDDQLVIAQLSAVCPPVARRPHLQEGLLVGRFPVYDLANAEPKLSDLRRRLVARIDLIDDGDFWSDDFPRMRDSSLLPAVALDPLAADFRNAIAYELTEGLVQWRESHAPGAVPV